MAARRGARGPQTVCRGPERRATPVAEGEGAEPTAADTRVGVRVSNDAASRRESFELFWVDERGPKPASPSPPTCRRGRAGSCAPATGGLRDLSRPAAQGRCPRLRQHALPRGRAAARGDGLLRRDRPRRRSDRTPVLPGARLPRVGGPERQGPSPLADRCAVVRPGHFRAAGRADRGHDAGQRREAQDVPPGGGDCAGCPRRQGRFGDARRPGGDGPERVRGEVDRSRRPAVGDPVRPPALRPAGRAAVQRLHQDPLLEVSSHRARGGGRRARAGPVRGGRPGDRREGPGPGMARGPGQRLGPRRQPARAIVEILSAHVGISGWAEPAPFRRDDPAGARSRAVAGARARPGLGPGRREAGRDPGRGQAREPRVRRHRPAGRLRGRDRRVVAGRSR